METVNIMELAYNLIRRIEQQDVILIAVLVVFVLQYAWLVKVWIDLSTDGAKDCDLNMEKEE